MTDIDTERRLRQALGAVADGVRPRPDAYQRALAEWRRRERRRRVVGVLIACLAVATADLVGVWALNRQQPPSQVVFDAPPPAVAPAVPGGRGTAPTTAAPAAPSGLAGR